MKRLLFLLCTLHIVPLYIVLCPFVHQHCPSVMASVPSYTNPILPYDFSDPDVCRVGDTYLLTSSSFNNLPGLQILASKDLVHWQIVDAALRDKLPGYEAGAPVLGNFVWAPSIREHAGRLYIYYGDPDRGIYCVRSKPMENGLAFPLEWEEAVLVMPAKGYIDPCPLWDEDGRVYLAHALAGTRASMKSVLLIAELNEDGMAVKTPSRIVFDGHEGQETCEGPKLYKRNGYYYIMHPAGGVKQGWQVVQRSKNIYGPYELKVTLAQGRTAMNGPHQGGWVTTPEGEDWFLHFQDVGVAGRVVHLQPMRWVDDWPVMGSDGEPVYKYEGLMYNIRSDQVPSTKEEGRKTEPSWANFMRRDEFDSLTLALDWQWAGGYISPKWFFCDAAHSRLRLYSAPRDMDDFMPNMLLQKIPAVAFTVTTRLRFTPNSNPKMRGAEQAGLIVCGRQNFRLEVPVTDEWCFLRLQVSDRQQGQFFISQDGLHWTKKGDAFELVEGNWIGAQVGLFCTRDNRYINDSGFLDVDWFEIKP